MRAICLLCLVLGYGFGLVQTAYLYSNSRNIDIQKEGSGNAGTTNMIRVMGWKAGLFTFLGDIAKLVVAVLLAKWVFVDILNLPIDKAAIVLYTGLGVVLGHNFPFYLHFKGGKGVAVSAALIVCLWDWKLILIGAVFFFVSFFITKYVSLGSILMLASVAIAYVIFIFTGLTYVTPGWQVDCTVLIIVIAALGIFMHRENIKRLLSGTENKFSASQHNKEAREAGEIVDQEVAVNKAERKEYKAEKKDARSEYKSIKKDAKHEYKQVKRRKPTKYRKNKYGDQ